MPQRGQRSGRQRQPDRHRAVGAGGRFAARFVEDAHVVAGHRHRGRAGLDRLWLKAHGIGDDRPAGLGLPPVVDHRHAEQVGRPAVGLRVQALAGQEQVAQRSDVVGVEKCSVRVLLLHRADCGGRGEQCRHAVFGDHPPQRTGVRGADRLAFVEHGGAAGEQGAVDDVGVADDPADVGGRPEDFTGVGVVDVLQGPAQRDRVAAVVAHHALGAAGGAGGVEDVERVGGGHGDAVHLLGGRQGLVPVEVTAGQIRRGLRPLADDAVLRLVLGQGEGGVQQGLVRHDAGRFDAARGGDDYFGAGVVDAHSELVRGEPPEDDRVDGADAGTGQHRDDRLGNHRHIDRDAVALGHTEPGQHSGEQRDLVTQLSIGERRLTAGDRTVVHECELLAAPGVDVAVQCVVAGVQLPVGEPPVQRGL